MAPARDPAQQGGHLCLCKSGDCSIARMGLGRRALVLAHRPGEPVAGSGRHGHHPGPMGAVARAKFLNRRSLPRLRRARDPSYDFLAAIPIIDGGFMNKRSVVLSVLALGLAAAVQAADQKMMTGDQAAMMAQ